MIIMIALVCSMLATPDPRNCMIDNSLHHQKLGYVNDEDACGLNAMIGAAALFNIDPKMEYLKIQCVLPSVDASKMPG